MLSAFGARGGLDRSARHLGLFHFATRSLSARRTPRPPRCRRPGLGVPGTHHSHLPPPPRSAFRSLDRSVPPRGGTFSSTRARLARTDPAYLGAWSRRGGPGRPSAALNASGGFPRASLKHRPGVRDLSDAPGARPSLEFSRDRPLGVPPRDPHRARRD